MVDVKNQALFSANRYKSGPIYSQEKASINSVAQAVKDTAGDGKAAADAANGQESKKMWVIGLVVLVVLAIAIFIAYKMKVL